MRVRLTWPDGRHQTQELHGDDLAVGRAEDCDIVVGEAHVSKRHVRLVRGIVAVDLGSANGTFVDGARVSGAVVLAGRSLSLGLSGIRLEVLEEDTGSRADVAAAAVAAELRQRVQELEDQLETLREEHERRCGELIRAREALDLAAQPEPAPLQPELSELLSALRGDSQRVLEAVANLDRRLQQRPAAPAAPLNTATDGGAPLTGFFFRLQAENQELRRRLAELEGQSVG